LILAKTLPRQKISMTMVKNLLALHFDEINNILQLSLKACQPKLRDNFHCFERPSSKTAAQPCLQTRSWRHLGALKNSEAIAS